MLTEDQKVELKRLLELRKKQDKDAAELKEMNDLNALHKKQNVSNVALEEELTESASNPMSLSFKNKGDLELIIEAYNKKYSNLPPYSNDNPNFKPHDESKNGITTLFFESEAEAVDFAIEQAALGRMFEIMDDKMCVLAYSNGDGKLYHADAKVFEKGDPFVTPVINKVPAPLEQPAPEIPAAAPVPKVKR